MDTLRLMTAGLRLLSQEEVMGYYTSWKCTKDKEALEALVAHYGYMAFNKAFQQFARLGEDALDLAQELLCEVVEVLNREKLPNSKQNLTFWVEVFLDRKVREYLTQGLVNFGSYREKRLLRKLIAVRLELEEELKRPPTAPELAQALEISEEELENLLYLEEANRIMSLSQPHPQTGTPLEDMVIAELEDALERVRLAPLTEEEIETLDRFLSGEEVSQEELDALAARLRDQMMA